MQGTQDVFKRVEKKYMLTERQYAALRTAISGRLEPDMYGQHTINNLYYDTDDFALIRASIEKPVYKEKLRLRSYGTPKLDGPVFLELKKKFKGIVYKRRVQMTLRDADAYLRHGIHPQRNGQILREIDYFLGVYDYPTPKAFIAYDRLALAGDMDPGLRVTFDTNIRFRARSLDLMQGPWGTPILGREQILMEVKIPGAMPVWLSRVFSDLDIVPTSYSKYGTCYKTFILHEKFGEELAYVS